MDTVKEKNLKASFCVSEIEAAEILGLAPNSLGKDRKEGHLRVPFVKAGRRVIYSLADLKDWLIENRQYPRSHGGGNV